MSFKVYLGSAAVSAVVAVLVINYKVQEYTNTLDTLLSNSADDYVHEVQERVKSSGQSTKFNKANDLLFVKSRLEGLFPDAVIEELSPINDYLYKARINGNYVAIDKRGETLIKGQVYDLSDIVNSTDIKNATVHLLGQGNDKRGNDNNEVDTPTEDKTKAEPNSSTIEKSVKKKTVAEYNSAFDYIKTKAIHYPAKDKIRKSVILFGDNTCGLCRKLHKDIKSMQASGTEIYYALISRKGLTSSNAKTIDNILCSAKPKDVLDSAMLGYPVKKPMSCISPQKDFLYAAIKIYQIKGTPSAYDRNGNLISTGSLKHVN